MNQKTTYQGAHITSFDDNPRIMINGRENGKGFRNHSQEDLIGIVEDTLEKMGFNQRHHKREAMTDGNATYRHAWYGKSSEDLEKKAKGVPEEDCHVKYKVMIHKKTGYHHDDEVRATPSTFERTTMYVDFDANPANPNRVQRRQASYELQQRFMEYLR